MRLTKLTTLIAASMFILVVGLILNISHLFWMSGMLLSLPFVGWGYALAQGRGVSVRRRLPATGHVGEQVTVELEARNGTALPKLQLWLVDPLPKPLASNGPVQLPLHLPSFGSDRVRYQTRLSRRGLHRIPATRLVSVDPLGLSAFSIEVPCSSEILVYPRVLPLRPEALPLGAEGALSQIDEVRRRGESASFEGTREYQPGDPLRRVHWRSSARWGRLTVIEFEDERSTDLVIALETQRGSSAGKGNETSFEHAVTLAASLANLAAGRGHAVALVTPGTAPGTLRWLRGGAATAALMESLATVEADSEGSLTDALPGLAGSLPPGTAVEWITPLPGERLVSVVTALAEQRMAVTVLGIDRDSFAPGTREEMDWDRTTTLLAQARARCIVFRKGESIARTLAQNVPARATLR